MGGRMKKYLLFFSLFIVGVFILGCTTQVPEALGLPGANCTNSKECQQGLVCSNNSCKTSPSQCIEAGETCSIDVDCCSGLKCSNHKCISCAIQPKPPIDEQQSASYWANADIGITRYYYGWNVSQLVVRNNKIFQIKLTGIEFDGIGAMTPSSVLISPGSSVQVNVTVESCGADGSIFSKNVRITYLDPTYGTSYVFTGEKPLVGTCKPSQLPIQPPQCTLPAGFVCISYRVYRSGLLSLAIGQALGRTIKVTGVKCTMNANLIQQGGTVLYTPSTSILMVTNAAETMADPFYPPRQVPCTDEAGNTLTGAVGDTYSGKLYINYTEADTGMVRIITGSIVARYEA
jgi:hypothetical protein